MANYSEELNFKKRNSLVTKTTKRLCVVVFQIKSTKLEAVFEDIKTEKLNNRKLELQYTSLQ